MSTPRKKPTISERYAAMILLHRENGEPVIDREWAKSRTTDEIIDEFERVRQWDHNRMLAAGGPHHPANLYPLKTQEEHKPKTKNDVKELARTRSLERKHTAFRAKLAEKAGDTTQVPVERSKWRSAPMAGTKRSGMKKTMGGKVVRR
jgi:hypothetical protein